MYVCIYGTGTSRVICDQTGTTKTNPLQFLQGSVKMGIRGMRDREFSALSTAKCWNSLKLDLDRLPFFLFLGFTSCVPMGSDTIFMPVTPVSTSLAQNSPFYAGPSTWMSHRYLKVNMCKMEVHTPSQSPPFSPGSINAPPSIQLFQCMA